MVTLGTTGDVHPFIALGKGLNGAGHHATLCANARFREVIEAHGLEYAHMNDFFAGFAHSPEGRKAIAGMDTLGGIIKAVATLPKKLKVMAQETFNDAWAAALAARPDLIVFHPKVACAADFGERLGVPAIPASLAPQHLPTRAFPSLGFPDLGQRGGYNLLTHKFVRRISAYIGGDYVAKWRAANSLGSSPGGIDLLRPGVGGLLPVLLGYSPLVVPIPEDWPRRVQATGYWFLCQQDSWQPPAALEEFLAGGEPPVYVGFGSMGGSDPGQLTNTVIRSLQEAGARGILASGWGGLAATACPPSIFSLESAPHDWLFPRVAAVVHHGGAGTTAAGLAAGRPTVTCPFFGDQPFWGQRVHKLGAGPAPIPQRNLTAARLAAAVHEAVTSSAMQARAKALGDGISQEDGVARAVAILEAAVAAA